MSSSCSAFIVGAKARALSNEAIALVARRFAVLSEPMRLRLLQNLMQGERSVNALAEAAGGTQANVSRHLQTLATAGMVARRRDGLQVFYSISDPSIFQLCDLVCGSIQKQLSRHAAVLGPARAGAARR